MSRQVSRSIGVTSPGLRRVGSGLSGPARLCALLCLPYLLLSICNPLLHTCVEDMPGSHLPPKAFAAALHALQGPQQVSDCTGSRAPRHQQCLACTWARNTVVDLHAYPVLCFTESAVPLVLAATAFHFATRTRHELPRAPPIG